MAEILKIDNSSATGLEKAVLYATNSVFKVDQYVDQLFLGKPKQPNKKQKFTDKGLLYMLDLLTSVDMCNIINYSLNQATFGPNSTFDPKKDPPLDAISRAKWQMQNLAYNVQLKIDGYYSSYSDVKSDAQKTEFFKLLGQLSVFYNDFKNFTNTENGNTILGFFPQAKSFLVFFEGSTSFFNSYTDYRQIPDANFQKAVKLVDKVRTYCVAIQALNSPAALLSLAGNRVNSQVQREIQEIQKELDPSKIVNTIKQTIQILKSVEKVCNQLLNLVRFGQLIIKISVQLIRALKIISSFLKKFPLPNLYTTTGITTTVSSILTDVVEDKGIKNFTKRLSQANVLMSVLISLIEKIITYIQQVMQKLESLIINLNSCTTKNTEIVQELINVKDQISANQKSLDSFIKSVNDKKNKSSSDNRISGFTIQIVSEEVTEDSFRLRRRYGVAIDQKGIAVVKSSPTYASQDLIIINEVKQLLRSKGLLKTEPSTYTIEEENTINQSLDYLEDENINWELDSIIDYGLDDPENENDNSKLGLNAFINKLNGGKKLRKRVQKAIQDANSSIGR